MPQLLPTSSQKPAKQPTNGEFRHPNSPRLGRASHPSKEFEPSDEIAAFPSGSVRGRHRPKAVRGWHVGGTVRRLGLSEWMVRAHVAAEYTVHRGPDRPKRLHIRIEQHTSNVILPCVSKSLDCGDHVELPKFRFVPLLLEMK
ncbi:MAG: hypothetical protein NTU79_21450 [Planctomycetota bacterium]|nr:hypothetical protein [Planctomycetota bacterium]